MRKALSINFWLFAATAHPLLSGCNNGSGSGLTNLASLDDADHYLAQLEVAMQKPVFAGQFTNIASQNLAQSAAATLASYGVKNLPAGISQFSQLFKTPADFFHSAGIEHMTIKADDLRAASNLAKDFSTVAHGGVSAAAVQMTTEQKARVVYAATAFEAAFASGPAHGELGLTEIKKTKVGDKMDQVKIYDQGKVVASGFLSPTGATMECDDAANRHIKSGGNKRITTDGPTQEGQSRDCGGYIVSVDSHPVDPSDSKEPVPAVGSSVTVASPNGDVQSANYGG